MQLNEFPCGSRCFSYMLIIEPTSNGNNGAVPTSEGTASTGLS